MSAPRADGIECQNGPGGGRSGGARSMHWIDLAVLGVVIAFAAAAWRTGLAAGVTMLLAGAIGAAVAGAWHERVLVDLAIVEGEPAGWMLTASFSVLLAAVLAAGAAAARLARGLTKAVMLGPMDSGGGAIVGVLAAVVVVQAVMAVLVLAPIPAAEEALAESVSGRWMLDAVPVVRTLLPEQFDAALAEFAEATGERGTALISR